MNKLFKKLKSRKGESLLEALVAILVFTMSSIMMYSMVTTAADLNLTARKMDEKYRQQMYVAELAKNAGTTKDITIKLTECAGTSTNKDMGTAKVAVYSEKSGSLYAYYRIPEGGG